MGRKEEILNVLKDKDLSAKQIKRDLEKDTINDYNIELIRNYLLKLQKYGLIEKVNEKKEFIYRSVVNKVFKILEQIELADIPKELEVSIYETFIFLLPSYLKTQLDKVIKNKTQEVKHIVKAKKDFDKKNLYI